MYDFAYRRPASLADAVNALKAASDGKLLAGGMTLIPTLKQRLASPSDLIDLAGIAELKGIKAAGDMLTVGALATHAEVAAAAAAAQTIPALAALAESIGDPQVRHRGTIGGSIANNDPAADYPAAVLALGATVRTDRRKIAADDFFTGMFETALDDGEIVVAVDFPKPEKACYMKFPNPASRYAMVGVFVARAGGKVRVAVTGAAPCVFRHTEMEKALGAKFASDAIKSIKVSPDGLNSDIHGSAEYRAHLISVMAQRAVAACA
ncbi:MAG: xanthine dehydrogenase family protein subunit M [Dongiaceae bacterium]